MSIFDEEVAEALLAYEQSENNDGTLLLEVFRRAAQYGIPAPPAAYLALVEHLERYRSGEARTLDEAFNVSREGWTQSAATVRAAKDHTGVSMAGRLYLRAEALRIQDGLKLLKDGELWEILAGEFGVSPGRAYQVYYEIKKAHSC